MIDYTATLDLLLHEVPLVQASGLMFEAFPDRPAGRCDRVPFFLIWSPRVSSRHYDEDKDITSGAVAASPLGVSRSFQAPGLLSPLEPRPDA